MSKLRIVNKSIDPEKAGNYICKYQIMFLFGQKETIAEHYNEFIPVHLLGGECVYLWVNEHVYSGCLGVFIPRAEAH